jgi:hypothetical protein
VISFFLRVYQKIEMLFKFNPNTAFKTTYMEMKQGLSVKGINGKCVLLLPFMYLGHLITGRSIDVLSCGSASLIGAHGRSQNDKNNKLREAIICAVIDNKVPQAYYKTKRWHDLKQSVDGFLHEVMLTTEGSSSYTHVECWHAAGRGHNYDFLLTFTGADGTTKKEHKVEFKFNASKISDTPQFVSPMKPSQYLSSSYEEFFYDNYMTKIASVPPSREEWLKQIHNNAPPCVKHLQDKYYAGCLSSSQFTKAADDIAFYNLCKSMSKESIAKFITENELDIVKLTSYLRESQEGKVYMLFQPADADAGLSSSSSLPSITLQTVDPAHYTIACCVKNPKKSRYECVSETGKKINILLRWKNGNGIAFPAFQIS